MSLGKSDASFTREFGWIADTSRSFDATGKYECTRNSSHDDGDKKGGARPFCSSAPRAILRRALHLPTRQMVQFLYHWASTDACSFGSDVRRCTNHPTQPVHQ